jgi:adenosylhomocysteine nucleosidase
MVNQRGSRVLVTATAVEAKLFVRAFGLENGSLEERQGYLTWRSLGEQPPFRLVVTGIGPERAKEGLANALDEIGAVRALVGFGVAGGLAKSGERGDLVIPTKIQWGPNGELPTEWLRMSLSTHASGRIWRNLITVSEVASFRAEKAALFAATDAEAVDMESGAWGALCQEMRIPWGIVRVILDPADQTLPRELSEITDSYGRPSLSKALPLFFRHPGLIKSAFDLSGGRLAKAAQPMMNVLCSWLKAEN